jgi:bifunctional enzyme CysN/CysC
LVRHGLPGVLLDADTIRSGLNSDLGFNAEDRRENVRRIAEVARMFARAGSIAIVASISPSKDDRARAQTLHSAVGLDFVEVYMATPLEICRMRDPKGLYLEESENQLAALPGSAVPYDPPVHPDLVFDAGQKSPREIAEEMFNYIKPFFRKFTVT